MHQTFNPMSMGGLRTAHTTFLIHRTQVHKSVNEEEA